MNVIVPVAPLVALESLAAIDDGAIEVLVASLVGAAIVVVVAFSTFVVVCALDGVA